MGVYIHIFIGAIPTAAQYKPLNKQVMKKIIYDYLKKNVACDNWGVICLDDFCKEYGFTVDSVCDTLEEMKDKISCAYFMENFSVADVRC